MKPRKPHTIQAGIAVYCSLAILLFLQCTIASRVVATPLLHEIPPIGSHSFTRAYGINSAGVVCAKSYTTDEDDIAMIWDPSADPADRLTALAALAAGPGQESSTWAINDGNQVSGFSRNASGDKRAVRWEAPATVTDLESLENISTGAFGPTSQAYGISNSGVVVGMADLPNDAGDFTPFHGFIHDGSGIEDIGTLNTSAPVWQYGYSIAYDLNSAGEIVGIANDNNWNYRPFIYTDINGMEELPIDPAYPDGEWYAVDINTDGMIVGHVIISGTGSVPHYWPDRTSTPAPIPMPAAFSNGELYAVNDAGQMVGIMWNNDTEPLEHAFIFDTVFGLRDLNDLVDSESGWLLNFARDINDAGQIAGAGTLNGVFRGFMLDALDLNRPGDANNDGSVDLTDVIIFLQLATGRTGLPVSRGSDMDGDEKLGVSDAVAAIGVTLMQTVQQLSAGQQTEGGTMNLLPEILDNDLLKGIPVPLTSLVPARPPGLRYGR